MCRIDGAGVDVWAGGIASGGANRDVVIMKQPKIRYLDDAPKDDWYVLVEPVSFRWKDVGFVRIPAGYVSDGARYQSFCGGFFRRTGPILYRAWCMTISMRKRRRGLISLFLRYRSINMR